MRALLIATLTTSLLAATAQAAVPMVVTCTASCTAPDGTTQPSGTNLNRILCGDATCAGVTVPGGQALVQDTGQALYSPAVQPVAATYSAPPLPRRTIQAANVQQALFPNGLATGGQVVNITPPNIGSNVTPAVWLDWTSGASVGAACNASGGAVAIYPAPSTTTQPGSFPVPAVNGVVTICSPVVGAVVSASGG